MVTERRKKDFMNALEKKEQMTFVQARINRDLAVEAKKMMIEQDLKWGHMIESSLRLFMETQKERGGK